MRQGKLGWHFDLSATLMFGLMAVVLVSLPGGCWGDETPEESTEPTSEAAVEPTTPPMMEIVEPEPGVHQPTPGSGQGTPTSQGDAPGNETGSEGTGEDQQGEQPEDEQAEEDPAAQDGTYVVQEGDTLYDIAVQLNVTVDALAAENDIDDPGSLRVGQVLRVPE